MAVMTGGLAVGRPGGREARDALFDAVPGLDGAPGSVSLELVARPGCSAGADAAARVACRGRKGGAGAGSDDDDARLR
ncbi:hypothetical protein U9M48_026988 [Paspalum notatum var. saurae]|uniref:Uncharacterized protein n=1 Tax=Paspalum notatum var. saurae TaxID=547442 RepID=A0AAQ3WYW7_PASNO